jgi:hypothetical protein
MLAAGAAGLLAIALATSLPASVAGHTPASVRSSQAAFERYVNTKPYCSSGRSTCVNLWRYSHGQYVGPDEPSVLFKSKIPGSEVMDEYLNGQEAA